MPAENRVRRDDRRHFCQKASTETGAEDSQAPPFTVGEPHSLISQLRLQDAVLFAQVLDDFVLFALEPAEERRDEQLQRNHSAESTPIAPRGFRTLRGSRLLEGGWPVHHVQHMLGHASLQQTSTYLNATLRGLHESMQNLDQSRPACKPLAKKPARGLRPFRKQAPARNGKSLLH